MPAGAVARLGVRAEGKSPCLHCRLARGGCGAESWTAPRQREYKAQGARAAGKGALARLRQVERAFGTTGRSGRDEQMACTAEFGHPPGPRTA